MTNQRVFVSEGSDLVAYEGPRTLEDVKHQYVEGKIDEQELENAIDSVLKGEEGRREVFRSPIGIDDD